MTTLDYHVRRLRLKRAAANLVPVNVAPVSKKEPEALSEQSFALILGNGRRIEANWNFDENQLARLIRVAGAA